MNTNVDFKGIDWSELSLTFGLDMALEDDLLLEKTKEFILNSLATENEKQVADLIRQYLKKLYETSKPYKECAELWKIISEFKNDYTVLKYTHRLLIDMWK